MHSQSLEKNQHQILNATDIVQSTSILQQLTAQKKTQKEVSQRQIDTSSKNVSTKKEVINKTISNKSQQSKTTSISQSVLSPSQQTVMRSTFLQLINQERNVPVTLSNKLLSSSQLRATEASRKWSHTRPNGTRWNTTLKNIINIKTIPHGENLAQTVIPQQKFTDEQLIQTTRQLHQALVNSPTHYHVMTNKIYTKVNIGIYIIAKEQSYIITIAQHYLA